jgi:voltage-gated potassium channel
MDSKTPPRRSARWLAKRVERKGLRPRYAAYVIVAFWSVAIVIFGVVERLVDPKTFDNVWLGIWWAIQTVTTVGYGDVVPGSTAGKVIASVLMLGGLSLLSVVTAAITSAFVTRAQERYRAEHGDPVIDKLAEVSAQLEQLKAELAAAKRPASAP